MEFLDREARVAIGVDVGRAAPALLPKRQPTYRNKVTWVSQITWPMLCSVPSVRGGRNYSEAIRWIKPARRALDYAVAIGVALLASYCILQARW